MNEQLLKHLLELKRIITKIQTGQMHGLNWYRILEPILNEIVIETNKLNKT